MSLTAQSSQTITGRLEDGPAAEWKKGARTGSTAGIGLAIATALASEGATVIIAGRGKQKLEEASKGIQSFSGIKAAVSAVAVDLGTVEGVETMIRSVPDVDILVNNLGI